VHEKGQTAGAPPRPPAFREALTVWVRIGLLSFGGPTGQIALMHRELVERRRWISDRRFLHALNYCMLLPGPEAQQLAIYTGWLLHGRRGGIAAGVLFVLPGAVLLWLISFIYVRFGNVPLLDAAFYGLKPAVMALVAAALLRLSTRALRNPVLWAVSGLAFVAIAVFQIPFPWILVGAAATGWAGGRFAPARFATNSAHGPSGTAADGDYVIDDAVPAVAPGPMGAVRAAVAWTCVWIAPVLLCALALGGDHVLTRLGAFFSKAALLTFGGAYAVLPYVAQQAVETHGWLSAPQMMDGLGLAETTPGPLILVLQFVGFLAGWHQPGAWPPLLTATLAAAVTSWATFVPGFLFIFAGAPFFERSRDNPQLHAALSGITAAVVGVVLNLALWFGWHAIRPAPGRIDLFVVVVAVVCFWLLHARKLGVLPVVAFAAGAGIAWNLLVAG
jgi:chromate transporter